MASLPRDTSSATVPYFAWDGANNIVLLSGAGMAPAAFTLGDGMANPTTTLPGAAIALWDSAGGLWYPARTLGTSGYQAGTQQHAGAVSSTNYQNNIRTTALTTPINAQNDKGVRSRILSVFNNTDKAVAITISLIQNGLGMGQFAATLAADASNAYNLTANGVKRSDGNATGVTAVSGDFALWALPFDQITVNYQYSVAPTTGTIYLTYRGLT